VNNLKKIERAINFIENNLKEDINLDSVALEACCFKFHFHRLFKVVAGENVFDYIRRRRLFFAAGEILNSQRKISAIALDYMFESPEAFARSFKKAFQITPSEYRKNKTRKIHTGRIKLSLDRLRHYTRAISIQPDFTTIDEIELVGKQVCISKDNYQPLIDVWLQIKSLQKDNCL
jgi:AraC family transcriptional regulator